LLKWYYYVLLGVVALAALSMTWWSMFDLGVQTLSVPVLIAAVVSLIFDLGGVYLGLLSIQYAKTQDSGFWTELGTFAFIAASTYIVIQHGIIEGYPDAGVFMFAAAPIVLGILLKATLNYLNRQQRRTSGRITEKLPSVGWLTWFRYRKETWELMSVAMRGRVINAADRLEVAQDKHGIFGPAVVQATVKTPQIAQDKTENKTETDTRTQDKPQDQLSQSPGKKALTSGDKPVLPVWLPQEPDMKLSTLARTCLDNNVADIETIYRYAVQIKGQDVNKASLSRTLTREKQKLS
jgi:hypothetical protein